MKTNWIDLLLSNKGRINRKTFMLGLLPIMALLALLYVFLTYVAAYVPGWLQLVVGGVLALEALYFLANLSIKRLRDFGRPPVFALILFSPLLVAALFLLQQKFLPAKTHELSAVSYTLAITLAMIGFFWMLLEMLFRRPLNAEQAKNGD